jgi:tRNA A37 methylthiotransferase MiaB
VKRAFSDPSRRSCCAGGSGPFLELLGRIRELAPQAGIRSNFIVGFPGETPADLELLAEFLQESRMDAIGLFGYSDEEGTEGAGLDGKVGEAEVAARVDEFAGLADELMSQRAEERIGTAVSVLVENVGESSFTGRAEHQGPEDSTTEVRLDRAPAPRLGDLVDARVLSCDGIDLIAAPAISTAAAAAVRERRMGERGLWRPDDLVNGDQVEARRGQDCDG